MVIGFRIVANGLWLSLAAATSFAILGGFPPLSMAVLAMVVVVLAFWLWRHKHELSKRYEIRESRWMIPQSQDKLYWRHKPSLAHLAPGSAALGLGGFYFAYSAAHDDSPARVAKLVHQIFGVPGVVGFWTLLAVFLLAGGVEAMIGSRSSR